MVLVPEVWGCFNFAHLLFLVDFGCPRTQGIPGSLGSGGLRYPEFSKYKMEVFRNCGDRFGGPYKKDYSDYSISGSILASPCLEELQNELESLLHHQTRKPSHPNNRQDNAHQPIMLEATFLSSSVRVSASALVRIYAAYKPTLIHLSVTSLQVLPRSWGMT